MESHRSSIDFGLERNRNQLRSYLDRLLQKLFLDYKTAPYPDFTRSIELRKRVLDICTNEVATPYAFFPETVQSHSSEDNTVLNAPNPNHRRECQETFL
eukprot:UN19245